MTAIVVRARGLAVSRGGVRVAGPLSLDVRAGESVLLEGPSGCGKTSLLKAMGGLLAASPGAATEGAVTVAGLDPSTAAPRELARRVGQVFQVADEQLLGFDVEGEVALRLENQGIPEAKGAPRVARQLKAWGLEALAERPAHALSTGEAKRVALAAALVTEPDVVLLDEPLTGLDPAWRKRLAKDLARIRGSVAVVVAEHHHAEARALADRRVSVAPLARPGPRARPFPEPVPPAPLRLRVSGLRVERERRVLAYECDFDLGPGLVALAGPNGAGKTTLLRVLAGLDAPAAGEVRLDGLDRPHLAASADAARRLGYAGPLSLDHFTASSVAEELALTPGALARRARSPILAPEPFAPALAAAPFHLHDLLDRHPLALSGGERQRLAFAAAAAHAPNVLLLDEPTVGLDVAGRAALVALVQRTRAAHGLVVAATHDEDLLARADRVLVIDGGRLHDAGDAESFFDGPGRRLGYRHPAEAAA